MKSKTYYKWPIKKRIVDAILADQDQGVGLKEAVGKHGITDGAFYKWKHALIDNPSLATTSDTYGSPPDTRVIVHAPRSNEDFNNETTSNDKCVIVVTTASEVGNVLRGMGL